MAKKNQQIDILKKKNQKFDDNIYSFVGPEISKETLITA